MPKTLSKYINYSFVRFVHSDEKYSARLNDNNYAVQPYIFLGLTRKALTTQRAFIVRE